jgi:CRP-like cAMP-binding protein
MLTTIEKVILLQAVDDFAGVTTADLAYIAAIAEEKSFEAGVRVFGEGDIASAMYLVIDGRVSLNREGSEIAGVGPNQAFGVWALFDEERRVVTAIAETETRVLRIDRDNFAEILADHAQIAQSLLQTLSRRLRGIMDRVQIDRNTRRT